jgi:hypothetical protein
MSHTISLPPRASHSKVTPLPADQGSHTARSCTSENQNSESTLYPRAFERVKEFLKRVLKRELEAIEDATTPWHSPIALLMHQSGNTPGQIVLEFCEQLLAYARHEYPFDMYVVDGESPLQWWEALVSHRHARVLVVHRRNRTN